MTAVHPSVQRMLVFFQSDHLPPHLQEISKPFQNLATEMAVRTSGPEATVGLRKLLEAKDCFVRAAIEAEADKG